MTRKSVSVPLLEYLFASRNFQKSLNLIKLHIITRKLLEKTLILSVCLQSTFAFIYTPRKNEANANNTVVTGNDRDGLFNVSETRNTIKTMQRILTLKGEVSLYC